DLEIALAHVRDSSGYEFELPLPPIRPRTAHPAPELRGLVALLLLEIVSHECLLDRVAVETSAHEQRIQSPSRDARIESAHAPRCQSHDLARGTDLVGRAALLLLESCAAGGDVLGGDPTRAQLLFEPPPSGWPAPPAAGEPRPRELDVVDQSDFRQTAEHLL